MNIHESFRRVATTTGVNLHVIQHVGDEVGNVLSFHAGSHDIISDGYEIDALRGNRGSISSPKIGENESNIRPETHQRFLALCHNTLRNRGGQAHTHTHTHIQPHTQTNMQTHRDTAERPKHTHTETNHTHTHTDANRQNTQIHRQTDIDTHAHIHRHAHAHAHAHKVVS